MKIYRIAQENPQDDEKALVPSILYHATYREYLDSIMGSGLGASNNKNWSESNRGVVYLALDPYVAESYAEAAEEEDVPSRFIDNIVILEVDTNGLDQNKFFVDKNVLLDPEDQGTTFEYHGVIPASNLKLWEMR